MHVVTEQLKHLKHQLNLQKKVMAEQLLVRLCSGKLLVCSSAVIFVLLVMEMQQCAMQREMQLLIAHWNDCIMSSFVLVRTLAGAAGAVGAVMLLICFRNFQQRAAIQLLPLLADFLCWIMQLGTFNVSNSNAIRVANILQCVQQQFEAVVKAWSMGHVSGGLF